MHTLRALAPVLAFALWAFPQAALAADAYPARPIRFVVPFPPGGGADVAARIIAQPLMQTLGQTLVIDNRPGADGAIAGEMVMRSTADGYTLFFGTNSAMSAVPALRKTPPYDPTTAFTPITLVCGFTFFLYVHPGVPAKTLAELLDYARANPGKLNYGTGNTTAIVATAQLKMLAGLDVAQVPYKGDAPTTADLLPGRIQFAFMGPIPGFAQMKAGKLRVVATLLTQRSPLAPDVPTMAEAGLPGVTVAPWGGLFGPANMPKQIVERLSREFNVALRRADVREPLSAQGIETQGSTPQELAAHVKTQLEAWKRAVSAAGIPLE